MKMKSFTLTKVDPELWKEFKAACAYYDISIRETLIKHVQNIVNDYLAKMKELYQIEQAINKTRKKK